MATANRVACAKSIKDRFAIVPKSKKKVSQLQEKKSEKSGGHQTLKPSKKQLETWCDDTAHETESETSNEDNDEALSAVDPNPTSASNAVEATSEEDQYETRIKGVSLALNEDGSVRCDTLVVERLEKEACWFSQDEKTAMTDNVSKVVRFYAHAKENGTYDGSQGDCDPLSYIHALTTLQKNSHKLSMQQACQQLATIGLHSNNTRGLESYVICDTFDYLRQKHLLRILTKQNELEEQYGMHYERRGEGDVEGLIAKELSRTSLRWSVRSSQYARLIGLMDKHAAKEAMSSPWERDGDTTRSTVDEEHPKPEARRRDSRPARV